MVVDNFSFAKLFQEEEFSDRYLSDQESAVDVVMPLLHGNELFRKNLFSVYKQIPVNRLLISDGGVIDNSIEVLSEFPRVQIFDHREVQTLGRCLALLFGEVKTEAFCYLHSDVLLPDGWFEEMNKELHKVDWVGSPMQIIALQSFRNDLTGKRPLAGAQMGRNAAFEGILEWIQDDFVYRQEDFVLSSFLERNGFTVGNAMGTFHYHQSMARITSGEENRVSSFSIVTSSSQEEERRVLETQTWGFIKYCDPTSREVVRNLLGSVGVLLEHDRKMGKQLIKFARATNPNWLPVLRKFLSPMRILPRRWFATFAWAWKAKH